jgi:cytochrome bd-type quinol oxidase subunit 2
MVRAFGVVDGALRGAALRGSAREPRPVGLWSGLAVVAAGGAVYGGVMGAFGGFAADRLPQIVFSAIKVPLLLAATTALALPSFFVLNTLLGLRDDFPEAARAVAVTQAAVAVVLAAVAPYTALWYASTTDYHEALVFNALMFAVASTAAQWVLRRRYARLVARNRRHRVMLWAWLGAYAFVGIQMGWVLRPFVGQPHARVTFFREGSWGNAYVAVLETAWLALKSLGPTGSRG